MSEERKKELQEVEERLKKLVAQLGVDVEQAAAAMTAFGKALKKLQPTEEEEVEKPVLFGSRPKTL